ncbi:MAG: extensin family protein [Myxococcota bacterium]
MKRLHTWFWIALACGALAPAPARAQAAPALREQLEALRRDPPTGVSRGTLTSIEYLLDTAGRIEGRFEPQAASWRERAKRYLEAARQGVDPYARAKGEIVNRGYRSPITTRLQGYAVYLPPDYDPSKEWPLYVALHGGSSNGNLFLGVVLGNNMPWKKYPEHLWDDYEPRWKPPFIVVAPTGMGQVMWRWMGEQDVLDVIEDVRRHYSVDGDRVVLGGLSNGGVGAYAIGMRHAWRFAAVQAMAGAPSWIQYAGGRPRPEEMRVLERWSGLHLAPNIVNTDFRYYHGRTDGGPMKPRFVDQLSEKLESLGLPRNVTWYDTGHDILYLVHQHGRVYEGLAEVKRNRRPSKVTVITGDYRANRQHWVTVTRIEGYPSLARVDAQVEDRTLTATTDGVRALAFDLRDAPLPPGEVRLVVDGSEAYRGPRARLGHVVHLLRDGDGWRTGFPRADDFEKRPGVSGPLTDAYHGRMVHVYGTQSPEHTEALRKAARQGSNGWPLWLWDFDQQVVADTEVDEALMRSAHLVLYGTAGDNAVLERIHDRLPIRLAEDAVVVGERRFEGDDVGARFIHPNPLAPDRYVIVQGGVTPDAVRAGHRLPDFLPDYVVYDGQTTRSRPRLTLGSNAPRALGYFDDRWRLPKQPAAAAGDAQGDPAEPSAPAPSTLPVTPPPPDPPRPRRFAAPPTDPAGRIARSIARRVPHFPNLRAEIPGATWRVDPTARWQVRAEAACLEELDALGVPFRHRPAQKTPVPTPVEILGPVEGVWLRSLREEEPLVLSCEMAVRLPELARVLARHGVRGVDVSSAVRERPRISFHTMGLGLDLPRFWTDHGWLTVARHFEATPDAHTCEGPPPRTPRARALRAMACDLYRTKRFSSVLTPNYNEGHRDHFHLDARPDDPRLYLR